MSYGDIYTTLSPQERVAGREVFEFLDGDLVDDDLQELITISLFTWRRANADDKVPEGASRQGWFGDADFGSRLWLLQRAKAGPAALVDARAYADEALAWMVTDKIVGSVEAAAELRKDGRGIDLSIKVRRPLQPEAQIRYAYLWGA